MIDEDKLKSKIEGLKSNLIHGACSSQVAMETCCKEEAYNEVLAIINSMQEEHKLKPKFQEGNKIVYVGERKELDTNEHTILYVYDDMYVTTWGKKIPFKFQDDYQLVEEHVSEFLNTESMIESYKQRLISQANGMKNSPFIDMCLASYKHGINEILDTLNLSNVERTGKKWKEEPISDDLEKVVEEIVDPIVLNAYGVKEIANRLRRTMIEPVSDELEQASHQFVFNTPSLILPLFHDADLKWEKTATEELERAFKAGANWQKECLMKDAVDGEIGYWNIRGLSVNMDLPRTLEEDDKVKLIIIKEDKV